MRKPQKTKIPKVKTNWLLKEETVQAIYAFCGATDRKPGEVIDWLIADAKDRMEQVQRGSVTVEQALEKTSVVTP